MLLCGQLRLRGGLLLRRRLFLVVLVLVGRDRLIRPWAGFGKGR